MLPLVRNLHNAKKLTNKKYINHFCSIIYCHYNTLYHFNVLNDKDSRKTTYKPSNFNNLTKILALFGFLGVGYIFQRNQNERRPFNYIELLFSKANCATKIAGLRDRFNFIADVVDQVAEAVVYIEITDSLRFGPGGPSTTANGSGFIISSDGLILTNAHVVVNHGRGITMRVRLSDGRTFPGRVESVDQQSDLATIRINTKGLPVLKLGSSEDLRVGEWVVAIGSPLTLNNTVTAGVISASHRPAKQLGIPHTGINYIQTDASITFGNSGGPLVNLDGEAIGINSIKISPGISFAIPIDYAKQFLATGRATHPPSNNNKEPGAVRKYVGITMVTLQPEFIHALHARGVLPSDVAGGILVWRVAQGGPAYRVGLRPGDVITHVNGKMATTVQDMYSALENSGTISTRVVRNGTLLQFDILPE